MSFNKGITEEKEVFQRLTPQVIKGGKAAPYITALKFAIDDPQLKNIALTGSYGAGKSSVILTFEDAHKGFNYLKISLAAFNKVEDLQKRAAKDGGHSTRSEEENLLHKSKVVTDKENGERKTKTEIDKAENLERLLEISILQQIFYHVKHKDIPDSRFKRIINLDKWNQMQLSAGVIAWFAAVWYLFFPNISDISFASRIKSEVLDFSMIIIFFSGLFVLVQHLRRIYNNSKVNRLNVQSGEFEVDEDVDRSVLNKHLDELIYFFEVTNFDVVVIEDLDRFESTEIFSKLREINHLLNNSQQIGRKITFIYAVRDNMFADENRTKFFDFVIPVVPVTDPTNAGNTLKKLFEKVKFATPNEHFLRDISTFITDMRFLNNVFNEYNFYFKLVNAENLEPEKLFGIILYKNFHPKDFMDLQQGKGGLFNVLQSKRILLKEKLEVLDSENREYKSKIGLLRSMSYKDENDLRWQYILHLQNKEPEAVGLIIDNNKYRFQELASKTNFDIYRRSKKIEFNILDDSRYGYHPSLSRKSAPLFEEIEKQANPDLSYEERLKMVAETKAIDDYQKQIRRNNQEKDRLKKATLSDLLFQNDKLHKLLAFAGKNEVVYYLVLNGYIAEDYSAYISKFVEGSLTFKDNEFKKAVLAGKSLPIEYSLDKTGELISQLDRRYFESSSILNTDILDALFEYTDSHREKLELFLDTIIRGGTTADEIFRRYIEEGKNTKQFINALGQTWPGLLDFTSMLEDIGLKDKLTHLILKEIEAEKLYEFFTIKILRGFLAEIPNFITVTEEIPEGKIEKILADTGVVFKTLEAPKDRRNKVLKNILVNHRYLLEQKNIEILLRVFGTDKKYADTFQEYPYTTIRNCGIEPLERYVENNLAGFVAHFLLPLESIKETEMHLIQLLIVDEDRIEPEIKYKIISKIEDRIENLGLIIEDNIQDQLLIHSKVRAQWNILNEYYERRGVTQSLIDFLNKKENYEALAAEMPYGNGTEFITELLNLNELDLDAYTALIGTNRKKLSNKGLDLEALGRDKVEWLIKNELVGLNQRNFSELKEHHPGLEIELIVMNQNEIEQILDSLSFEEEDLGAILESKKTNPVARQTILARLRSRALEKSAGVDLPDGMFVDFINGAESDREKLLLISFYDDLEMDEAVEILSNMSKDYSKLLKYGKRKTITDEPENRSFAAHLEKLGIIKMESEHGKIRLQGKGIEEAPRNNKNDIEALDIPIPEMGIKE